jgi:hypothetical protein
VQRNLSVRLLWTAPLLAVWLTIQFPALLFPSSELPDSRIFAPESTSDFERAGMPAYTYATTGSRLPSSISALPPNHSLTQSRVSKISERLPLHFESNYGQSDKQVKFVSRARGYSLTLTPSEVVMELQKPPEKRPVTRRQAARAGARDRNDTDVHARGEQLQTTVRMKLVGATTEPKVFGTDELPGKSNYFIGNDPKKWRKNVPHYAKVRYEEVYPGIDLVFYGNQSQWEFDFIVAPGADPDVIRLAFEGADEIDIDKEGHLKLQTSGGSVRVKKPFVYQELDGVRQEISSRYLLSSSAGENPSSHVVAFELASHDPTKLLVIDPGLEFSTFLGGSGLDDGEGIALDASGNIYVVGNTGLGYGVIDVFVAKFSADFTLLYATVFGGSTKGKIGVAGDWGRGIAVDSAGNAYVAGRIESSDFPTTDGTTPIGYADAFVAKLSSDGSTLLFSRRLGGSGQSDAFAIALDSQGSAYVTGWTTSPEFPTTPGALDTTPPEFGYIDTFVVKLSADGSQLLYSTFLGGTTGADGGGTQGFAIAVDASGNAHVAGQTGWFSAPEFRATPGAFDTSWNGGQDAFVAKLSANGSQLLYATYIGGRAQDHAFGVALDTLGNAYVTGWTESSDFPTTPGALETIHGVDVGSGDAFVVKLSTDGSRLLYSTFLGGSLGDAASGIAVDGAGNAYVIGTTCSHDFPTTAGTFSGTQISRCGIVDLEPNGDTFVAKLSADGSRLLYSTYLGGGAGDQGTGIAVDSAGNVYVTGRTNSLNFPTTPDAFEPGGGPWDAFVAKLSIIDTDVNPGTIGFDAIGYTVHEDSGTAVVTVIRRNGKDGEVSVDYATGDSEFRPSTAGLDYVPTSGTLVFAHGETKKNFTISILDDGEHEEDESLAVTLSNVRGGAALGGNRTTVTITIKDQDPIFLPTLTVIKAGNGIGTVTDGSRRFGINCGSACSDSYLSGTSVILTASPASGSTFAGWSGGGCSGTGSCALTITANTSITATFNLPTLLAIASSILPEGLVGNGYNAAVAATGGLPPYSLKVVKGSLPPGLILNGLGLTGTPGAAGKFKLTLQLTDSNNASVSRPFTTRIFKALAIKTADLPAGRAGRKYSGKLAATGGKAPYSWSLVSSSLPSGLFFDPTGRITGVPIGAGNFAISFRATDALGGATEKTVALNVRESSD